jgi:putative transposase
MADSFDNALAETTNGLYKTECVYGPDAAVLEPPVLHRSLAGLRRPS